MELYEALKLLFDSLEQLRIPYAVVGSFASGGWGQPRYTNDIDIVIAANAAQLASLTDALESDFWLDRQEIEHTLDSTDPYRTFQLLHKSHFKVDVFMPPLSDYNFEVIRRAQPLELAPGVFARTQSAEDAVISKLNWFVLGNRVSDRQWNDIVQVIDVQRPNLDLDYLQKWATHFNVLDLLQDAMSQAAT